MEWKTAIAEVSEEGERIRGYALDELIGRVSFAEAIWLVLRGELPSQDQRAVFEAVLVSFLEHGIGTPSAMTTRIVSSCAGSVAASAAAGLLTVGPHHGGAIVGAATLLQNGVRTGTPAQTIVETERSAGRRIPGFGHRVLTHDKRASRLQALAQSYNLNGPHMDLLTDITEALNANREKSLPVNIDGMAAAVLSDIGFGVSMLDGIFVVGRLPGLVAHAAEEAARERPLRRLELEETEYDGPLPRNLERE